MLAVLFLCLGMAPYAGLSEWMVGAAFRGETTLVDPVAKLGMTALTVGAGLQGGEVTPLFGIGASDVYKRQASPSSAFANVTVT